MTPNRLFAFLKVTGISRFLNTITSDRSSPSKWLAGFIVASVFLASWVHIPANDCGVNYFDPPKLLVWGCLLVGLTLLGEWVDRRFVSVWYCGAWCLVLWMLARTLLGESGAMGWGGLVTWLLPILLFMVSSLTIQSGRRVLSGGLLWVGGVQFIVMVLQYFGHDPLFPETTALMEYAPGRMIGTIGYHNQALDFVVLCSSGLIMSDRRVIWRVLGFSGIFTLACMTANRGGMVSLLMALIVVEGIRLTRIGGVWSRAKRVAVIFGAIIVCIAAAMLLPVTRARILEPMERLHHSPAVGSRLVMGRIAYDMWVEKPLLGWGAGEYARQYCERLGHQLPEEKTHAMLHNVVLAREAHNDVLQFLAEFGLIGFAMGVGLLGLVLRVLWKGRQDHFNELETGGFVVTYMVVAGLVSFPCQTSMAGPLAALVLGACVAGSSSVGPERELSRRTGRYIGISMFSLFSLSLGVLILFCGDSFLNSIAANPRYLSDPKQLESLIPHAACRYRAIVGSAYAAAGDYAEAERILVESIDGYSDPIVYNNLGFAYCQQGKWGQALEIYKQWVACGIRHDEALANLSIVYENMGNSAMAAATLEQKLMLWPSDSEEDVRRMAVLQLMGGQLGKCKGTIARYEQKLARWQKPLPAEFENIMGAAEMRLGRYVDAENRFKSALSKKSTLASASKNLALLHELCKKAEMPESVSHHRAP